MSQSTNSLGFARVMFGANILFAGVPGFIITAFPTFARTEMFANAEPLTLGMLGAIWLSIGLVSVAGLRDPARFLGVFAVQALYKTIWVATGASVLWNAHPEAPTYGIGFALAAIGFTAALVLAWRKPTPARPFATA